MSYGISYINMKVTDNSGLTGDKQPFEVAAGSQEGDAMAYTWLTNSNVDGRGDTEHLKVHC